MVCVGVVVKRTVYQRKVDLDMLSTVKSVLTDVTSVNRTERKYEKFHCGKQMCVPVILWHPSIHFCRDHSVSKSAENKPKENKPKGDEKE